MAGLFFEYTRLPGRANLRSAHQGHYDVSRVATGLDQRSLAVAGPKAWNSLPSELRCIAVDSTFRRSCFLELMAFLLTFSSENTAGSRVAARPFGQRLG